MRREKGGKCFGWSAAEEAELAPYVTAVLEGRCTNTLASRALAEKLPRRTIAAIAVQITQRVAAARRKAQPCAE